MVNIDTVYQTVQALANKEQRGYLTPQEFNLFANQAQADIFEQYFYDLNAFRGARPQERQVGDSVTFLQHKLANVIGVTYSNVAPVTGGTNLPTAGHTGQIFVTVGGIRKSIRPIDQDEIHSLISSKWHREAFTEAVYFEDGYQRIQVWSQPTIAFPTGQITTGVTCEEVTGNPGLVFWGYTIVNEKATWNPATTSNFDLHESEQPDLVAKILKLAGISIENQEIYQAGAAEEGLNTQQENK
tara:strand:- start:667 stop:1392 length:726 start_codon:yes stop_codon:yes gene_type:complete